MKTAFGVCYEGTEYSGWQAQNHCVGVQNLLDKALAKVAGHPVELFCCGRTDAGVHATQQVVHMEHRSPRSEKAWLQGANNFLPPSIRILWAQPVDDSFHARFSTLSRFYQYVLLNQSGPHALEYRYTGWDFHPLELGPMQQAAALLLGNHDFSAFRSAHCQSHQSVRNLMQFHVAQVGHRFVFTVQADGFLHNMVRILVGTLLKVGQGEHPPQWVIEVLESKNRTLGGVTMPASGLFFCGAEYPISFGIPKPVFRC